MKAFVMMALSSAVMTAQNQNMLVSTSWVAERLEQPSIVVLHVGSQQDYDAGHIPGARLVTLGDISVTGDRGLRLQLPAADALEAALGKLGISDAARVIVYAGTDSIQSATRVWFTLDYSGLGDRSSLLDGGLSLWRAERRPTTAEKPRFEATAFKARVRPELVVDADWVRSNKDHESVKVVDARTPEFYTGASAGMMPRAGHIPGAVNAPFTTFFGDDRKLKSPDALRKLLDAKGTVVTYCHIGQQATVPYFVARYLGIDAKLYDGSFQDWSMRTELPVETAPR